MMLVNLFYPMKYVFKVTLEAFDLALGADVVDTISIIRVEWELFGEFVPERRECNVMFGTL